VGSLVLLLSSIASAQQKNFISCPIVRDTKTVPCYLAENEGELYYLGVQQDITASFHPPQLKHEVLVEGKVVPGPRVCGGIPLQPLSISVIREVNQACNTLLPPEPGIDAPAVARPAGPSTRRPEPAEKNGPPAVPVRARVEAFTVLYAFNDDFLEFANNRVVTEAAAYAKQISASSVKVSGYRATTLLSNGNKLVEKDDLAEKRAQEITTLLKGLGVANVTAEWKSEAEPADGQTDPSRRRVTITVTP
jgi:outer membrane protein OmpA-like peptidoglycan-associated protein